MQAKLKVYLFIPSAKLIESKYYKNTKTRNQRNI